VPSIGVVDAHHRSAILCDFRRAVVAHEDRLSCHDSSPFSVEVEGEQ
jgi:hypothetical protein